MASRKEIKEAGADFNEFFPSLSNSKKFPFILYNGRERFIYGHRLMKH
jgi:hypothetical protein